jgi:hypothetical protein
LAVFSPSATGSYITNTNGYSEFSVNINFKNATLHRVQASDANNAASSSISTIQINPAGYQRLQVLAAGEINDPDSSTGKSGTPTAQKVATPFNVTINAVDANWNLVNINSGDVNLAADVSATIFLPPNNADTEGDNKRPFINGVSTRQVVVGVQGPVEISAVDDDRLSNAGDKTTITINPGPTYTFQVSSSAIVGERFPTVTIRLEENGVPVAGYNRSIFIRPDLAVGGPGSGFFNSNSGPSEFVMNNGEVVISAANNNALVYNFSEVIQIHLEDEFGRVGVSPTIDVVPSGLQYRITVPLTPVTVGPPARFPVTVQLVDKKTGTLVKNRNHTIDIRVTSAENPTTAGAVGTTTAEFSEGVAGFFQSYTKAENIIITVSESLTSGEPNYVVDASNSLNVTMVADGYKKLLLLGPNEVHVPGVASPTGKTGLPANAQKDVPYLVQVRGVDQYWNVANDFSGGSIVFDSNDLPPSLTPTNPSNQGAALVNGASASNLRFQNPGDLQVTVRDASNPAIAIQSIPVRVGGLYFVVDGEPATQFTGSGASFGLSVTLYDSNTNQPVTTANQAITLTAKLPNGDDATGLLGVTSDQLSGGTANITAQHYSIAENIFIRVTDALGNSGSSDVISFVPRKINYTITAPVEATVNKPFHISVKTIDAFTSTEVKNLNRTIQISAISALTGQPVTGSFIPSSINIVNGVGEADPVYTVAEPIAIQLTDLTASNLPGAPQQPTYIQQGTINVHPGPLATIQGISDFQLQSNQERSFNLTVLDESGNRIPLQRLRIFVKNLNSRGEIGINGDSNDTTLTANGQGEITVLFRPSPETNGSVEIELADADNPNGYATLVVAEILGLGVRPAGALGIGEDRIPVNSTLELDISVDIQPGGVVTTFYQLDGGPQTVYYSTHGVTGFTETKRYTIDYYSSVCYPNTDPTCSSPVVESSVHHREVTTYIVDQHISGYPSPFNPKGPDGENFITFQYGLAQASNIEIDIYDLMGQKVWHKDINAGEQGAEARSDNRVFWFGTNDDGMVVANGGYITTVKVGATNQIMRTKILVVK